MIARHCMINRRTRAHAGGIDVGNLVAAANVAVIPHLVLRIEKMIEICRSHGLPIPLATLFVTRRGTGPRNLHVSANPRSTIGFDSLTAAVCLVKVGEKVAEGVTRWLRWGSSNGS